MTEPPPGAPVLHAALARNTGYLLSRIGAFGQRQFAGRLNELGLTTRMWGAMNVLDAEGAITQHALGKLIGMDPSTMVSTLDELEAHGLVERRRHPSDRRAYALHMTTQGHETLTRGRQIARQAQNQLLAGLDAEERSQLHGLLVRVALAAGAIESPAAAAPPTSEPAPPRATPS